MTDNTEPEYILSIDDNNLIVYKADQKYVCKNCIDPKTKKTKRLLCAIKKHANLTINFSSSADNNSVELRVVHPLYDDDLYMMYDDSVVILQIDPNLDINLNPKSITTEPAKSKPLCYIYVLFLEQDKYYVGRSLKPMTRTGDHLASTIFDNKLCKGSAWTRMYPPTKILEVNASYDEFDEDRYTIKYMRDKGIDNVRGGSFCELNLSRENVVTLEKMLAGAEDRCYYCGSKDHFIGSCPQKNMKRIPKKERKTTLKKRDIPKSKILKYYGTTQLLKNSDLTIQDKNKDKDKEIDTDTDTNDITKTKTEESFRCRYCNKSFTSNHNRNNHENLLCTKSAKVIKGRMIEADVDAILEANKKYIKNKK